MIVQRRREDATLIKKERRKILRKKSQFQKANLQFNQERRIIIQSLARDGQERVGQHKFERLKNIFDQKNS
jgi:hypothetical protein